MTDAFISCPWACPIDGYKVSVSKCVHYRIVFSTVGYGLNQFRGSQELLHATNDVFQGMLEPRRLCHLTDFNH